MYHVKARSTSYYELELQFLDGEEIILTFRYHYIHDAQKLIADMATWCGEGHI